jgi:hypothetical protein
MNDFFSPTASPNDRQKKKGHFVFHPGEKQPDKMRRALEEIDTTRAKKLRDFARKQGWFVQSGDQHWEEPLASLRIGLEDSDRIDVILDWYIGWWKAGKYPEVKTGQQLKNVWNWLSDLFNEHNAASIEISATARRICTTLNRSAHDERLVVAVQQSLNNYTAFRDKLFSVMKKRGDIADREMRTDSVAIRLKMLLSGNSLPDARMFVMEWFRAILNRCPDFDGNWKRLVVSEINDRFMGRVRFLLGEHAKQVLMEVEGKT